MNDLETRIRATLHDRADHEGIRTMPPTTRSQVHRREARFVTVAIALTVCAVVSGALVVRSLPRASTPPDVAGDGFTSPLEDVPDGWPAVDIGDPVEAFIPFPDSAYADGPKQVIASGTVDGEPFSLVGFMPSAADEGRGCFEYAPPWDGRPGSAGVMGSCVGAPDLSVPKEADLDVLGFSTEPNGHIEANMGFVSRRVERLEIRPEDESGFTIPILDGPDGWAARSFLIFFYEGAIGELVAYAEDGTVLARSSLCSVVGHSGGCRGSLDEIVPPSF